MWYPFLNYFFFVFHTAFLAEKLTSIHFNPQLVEKVTLIVFLVSAVMSAWLNIRDWRKRIRERNQEHEL